MRLFSNAKTLLELLKDYHSMDRDEKRDFYQSKCEYYQNYVGISLFAAVFFSITFIYSDYLINGNLIPTLIPRLSVLIALAIFGIIRHFSQNRGVTVLTDFFLAHAIAIAALWSNYHIEDKINSSQGLLIMNLVFLAVGFVGIPGEVLASSIIFTLEILISHYFISFENLSIIMAMQIPCVIVVYISHGILTLFYLDHYRIRQKLELAMVTDPLTQVYNRHLLEKIVTQNALKDVAGPVAIAMLDIDYFKQVNDVHGHYTGDLTLLYMGQKLAKGTHDNDYVIRYGGEEFIIILKNCDVNNACARMEQFRRDIETATDTPVPFTISVGVSRYTGDFAKSIQNVDNALYKAKNTGRNKVVVV